MIQKYIDLSTAHVSPETGAWLDDCPDHLIMYPKGEYGWIVFAASEEYDEGVPEDLMKVINYAKSLDCTWIMFDRDGDIIDEIPSYEW